MNVTLTLYGSATVKDLGNFRGVKMTGHLLRDADGNMLASFYGGAWMDVEGYRWSDVVISPVTTQAPKA